MRVPYNPYFLILSFLSNTTVDISYLTYILTFPTIHFSELNDLLESMIEKCEDGSGMYRCKTCGKMSSSRSKSRRHAEVHIDAEHHCIVCGKEFKTRNALSIHYTRYHGSEVASPWTTMSK